MNTIDVKITVLEWFASDWWTSIDGFITIGTLLAVIVNIIINRKQVKTENEKVKIIFDVDDINYFLDVDIPRKYITRMEIQGILGAFQKDISARYSIKYLSEISFLDNIFSVQQGKQSKITIKLTPDEFEQFNKDKMMQL